MSSSPNLIQTAESMGKWVFLCSVPFLGWYEKGHQERMDGRKEGQHQVQRLEPWGLKTLGCVTEHKFCVLACSKIQNRDLDPNGAFPKTLQNGNQEVTAMNVETADVPCGPVVSWSLPFTRTNKPLPRASCQLHWAPRPM